MTKRRMQAVAAVALAGSLSGCSWTGLNSIPLPFTKGGGDDRIEVTVQLANAANLVPNSEVKYDEITVGSVRKIELKDWTATLTLGIEGDARIPADVTAAVAQKSLLGAEYLALADPVETTQRGAGSAEPAAYLSDGQTIGLERTGRYPETEELLTAGSMLLNGGGLPQIRTIAHEMNDALGGRDAGIRQFVRRVGDFTGALDTQRDNIATTLEEMDRLALSITKDDDRLKHALAELPDGMEALESERATLVETMQSLDRLGRMTKRVMGSTKADLAANLNNLVPVTRALEENAKLLAESADGLTYPFPARALDRTLFGDYMNLITEVTVDARLISKYWLGGTPLDGLFNGLGAGTPVGPAGDALDPLAGNLLGGSPLDAGNLIDGLGGPQGGASAPTRSSSPSPSPTTKPAPLGGLVQDLLGGH